MSLGAALLAWARGVSLVRIAPGLTELPPALGGLPLDSSLASLALGALLAGVTIAGSRLVVHRTRWGRGLRDDFRALLADAGPDDAAWLALTSGVGEELLFRGALLPWWGLLASSLAFGMLHVGPSRRFLGWTLWATITGALLGGIYVATGRIEGAIVAHVLVNWVNLRFVLSFDGRLDAARSQPGEQSLVPKRSRRDTGR
jgi:membrane protease YdiL (CAAX protease family)